MEQQAEELALFLIAALNNAERDARILVGIAGIPASGKSTFAQMVVHRCNALMPSVLTGHARKSIANGNLNVDVEAILVGLDGWHLSRAQLNAMPDPRLAHDRRGAHWTFDGKGYVDFVAQLRAPVKMRSSPRDSEPEDVITARSFDHALKDPTPDAVRILPHHRIVIIEGLYCFLSLDPWRAAGAALDERWFIDVDVDEAAKRLVKRHVLTGVAKDLEDAEWRARNNDMPNGQFIIENMLLPTRRIQSVADSQFSTAVEHTPE